MMPTLARAQDGRFLAAFGLPPIIASKRPSIFTAGTLVAAAALALALAGCAGARHAISSGPAHSSAAVPAHSGPSPHRSASRSAARRAARSPRSRLTSLLPVVHDPGRVTGRLAGPCQARDHGRLPDRHCTPGAIDRAVTQADIKSTICVSGYTQTVRPPESQTGEFKFSQAYPAYGLAAGTQSELDHLVPLELGGANDAANLWPETGPLPNPKDAVERALNRAVCDNQISLSGAQRAIARNWVTAERSIGLSAPAPASTPARARSANGLSCRASVSSTSPADYTTVNIEVRTAAGASVTTVAHYKSTDHPKSAVADGAGHATVAYDVSGATPGYKVRVNVTASAGARAAHCFTSFTPVS
jgi:hypothetical protein